MDIGQAITSATVPVRAVITGSPVLARRLRAPATKRRTAEAEVRQAEAEALAAELAKLDPKARAAKQAEHTAADRAGRKERRSRAADIAGCTALVLLVAGPVAWHFARPYLGAATLVLIAAWTVAAMAHAPSAKQAAASTGEKPPVDPAAQRRAAVIARLTEWMEERPGIHLSEVYERYRQLPGHDHLTDDQIRAALVDHYGIPVRRAVADPRKTTQRTRAGIRRDDLKPLPSPERAAPVAPAVATGVTSTVAA